MADQFGIDDAAIRAAVAGFGMVLAPRLTTHQEIEAGTLVELPEFEPVEMGAFYLLSSPIERRPARLFRRWLMEVKNHFPPDPNGPI